MTAINQRTIPDTPRRGAARTPGEAGNFSVQTRQVMRLLQEGIGGLIEQLPGDQILHATDLARAVGIDNKLAWKIHTAAQLKDPFAAGQYLPGQAGISMFVDACQRAGVEASRCDEFRERWQALRRLIKTHAGSRKGFDMLLAGQAVQAPGRGDLIHRKAAFESQGYLYGVMARLHLQTYILLPGSTRETFHLIDLHANVELQRFRPNVPWRISHPYRVNEEQGQAVASDGRPIDPDHPADPLLPGLPLLKRFCSTPLPKCQLLRGHAGDAVYQLEAGPVGRTCTNTCVTGEFLADQAARVPEANAGKPSFFVATRLRTPCEVMSLDLVIPTALLVDTFDPEALLYSDLFAAGHPSRFECDRLPLKETVSRHRATDDEVEFDAFRRYRELLNFAAAPHGQTLDDLTVFRLLIPYPTIPSIAYMRYRLNDFTSD